MAKTPRSQAPGCWLQSSTRALSSISGRGLSYLCRGERRKAMELFEMLEIIKASVSQVPDKPTVTSIPAARHTTREFGFHSDPPPQHTSPPFNYSIDPLIYNRTPHCTAMPHTLPSHFLQGLLPVPLYFLPCHCPSACVIYSSLAISRVSNFQNGKQAHYHLGCEFQKMSG